jgi:hypothetical protein
MSSTNEIGRIFGHVFTRLSYCSKDVSFIMMGLNILSGTNEAKLLLQRCAFHYDGIVQVEGAEEEKEGINWRSKWNRAKSWCRH